MSAKDKIILVSEDDKEFTITRAEADHSEYMRNMLSNDSWIETAEGRLKLDMPDYIVKIICEYLAYKEKWEKKNTGQVPDFVEQVPKEHALELLMAADYLGC